MKKIISIIFLIFLFLAILCSLFSHSTWGQKKLKTYTETLLTKTFGAKTEVSSVDLLFPFFIHAKQIDITKETAALHIESFSCIPFWFDLPFNRITLLSLSLQGIEASGNLEKFLENSESPQYAFSVFHFDIQSLHVAHKAIPGKQFDGSLHGRFYMSSSLDNIKLSATVTRSLETVWPRYLKIHCTKQNENVHCAGSIFLEGVDSSAFFGPDDSFSWDFTATKVQNTLSELKGVWKLYCPTTERPLINNFVVNRMIQGHGSFLYKAKKECTFSCDDLTASMIFGKTSHMPLDPEGAGSTLMQYGEPLTVHATMLFDSLTNNQDEATIRFQAPSFSCNSFTGSLLGECTLHTADSNLIVASKADGMLRSDAIEAPIHFHANAQSLPDFFSFSSDLLVAPFHLSNTLEKSSSAISSSSSFKCDDLGVLQKYIPLLLSGAGEISFTTKESPTENKLFLASHFSHANIGPFSCVRADVAASSPNSLEKIDISFDLTSGKIAGLSVDKAQAALSINPKTLELQLSDLHLIGKAVALPFDLTGAGEGKIDSLQSYVNLTQLDGVLLHENVHLDSPFRLECIDLDELCSHALFSLHIGEKGSLTGQWIHPSPSRSSIELFWKELPFPIMAALTGIGTASGVMNGECHYQTSPRDATGSFQMQANVARCGALGSPEGSLSIDSFITLDHSELSGNIAVAGTGVIEPLDCTFTLPVHRRPLSPLVTLSMTAPFKASIKGKAQISKIFHYWMPEEIGCEAILSCDTKLNGTLENVLINGPVLLREGRMELLATGQVLENIEMDGQMCHRTLSLQTIKATDTGNGSLSGTGILNFFEEGSFTWKLFLACKDLEIVNLPYTNAIADGSIQLDGTAHSLLISGNGIAKKAFVDVAARFPKNIPELSVTFCGEEKKEKTPFLVSFDLYLEAPSGGEIRGRGLRTDWHGHAHLSGPVNKLNLTGLVECTKGTFTLAGKELSINQGTISVAGDLFKDSRLHVLAKVSLPSISVQVGLKGSLKDPKFFIQSTPILPEKEVLSLLLFNKEYSDISPLESLQLANAAMSLQQTSGPFDLIDHVKTTLGIDLIDIGSSQMTAGQQPLWSTLGADSEESEEALSTPQNNVTLKVGKYISNGIAVTVSKDVTAGVNRIGLEAHLSQHVTAEAEIGDDAGGIASLKWKKDY